MTELRRVRLGAVHEGWEARLDLKSLLNDDAWDPAPRMKQIELARELWLAAGCDDRADDPRSIVYTVWEYLLEDQQMREYVLDTRQQDVTSMDDWQAVAETYAFVILQRYNREMRQKP